MSKDKPISLQIDGEGKRIAIVAARYNSHYVNALLETVLASLDASGVRAEDVETFRVPGSNEIPYVAGLAAETGEFDVVIALGLIIRGETEHHNIIAHSTAHALQRIGADHGVPVINGIVVVENDAQAAQRCTGELDRGKEFAFAALEMAQLNLMLSRRVMEMNIEQSLEHMDWDDDLDDDDMFLDEDDDTPNPFR